MTGVHVTRERHSRLRPSILTALAEADGVALRFSFGEMIGREEGEAGTLQEATSDGAAGQAKGARPVAPSARALLVLSHLAVLVPVLAFSGFVLWRHVDGERARLEQDAYARVREVAARLDKRLAAATAAAETLAGSDAAAGADEAAFRRQALGMLRFFGESIALLNAEGRLLVSTHEPNRDEGLAGAPAGISESALRQAAQERRTVVSDLIASAGGERPVVSIAAPVLRGEAPPAGVVVITLGLERFRVLLSEPPLPSGWFAGLVDGDHRFLARSRLNDEVLGRPAPPEFRSRVGAAREGAIRLVNPEGVEVLNVYRRLDQARWIVSIGVPVELLQAPLQRSLFILAAFGFALLAGTAGSAYLLTLRMQRAAAMASGLAAAVGQGQVVTAVPTGVREVDAIAEALARISRDLAARGAERDASVARYRQALEVGRLGSWETDFVARRRLWSPEGMAIFGLSLADGVGQVGGSDDEWRAAFHEDERWMIDQIYERLRKEDEFDIEYRIRRPDGAIVHLHGHARVLERQASGAVARLVNVVADVTSRKTAEHALGATEARYRLLFENIEAGFCVVEVDLEGAGGCLDYRVVEANPAFYRQTGFSQEILGRWLREAAPDLEDHWFETYGRVARTGEPARFEQRAVALGRWFDVYAFRFGDGVANRVAILFTDITARRAAEEDLRQLNHELEERVARALAERRLFADVIENSAVFVQVVGLDWRWLAINKAAADEFESIFGVRPHVGEDMRTLLASKPEHRAAVETVWRRALEGEAFTDIADFGEPGRRRRTYEMRFYPLAGIDGARIGAYQFVTDVTDQVEAQRKLAEMQKVETIGQLTGSVAHDFNNLLAAILSNLDLARKRIDDRKIAKLLDGAIKGAERGATLTKRLLAFARRQELKSQAVKLDVLIDGMRELIDRSRGDSVAVEIRVAHDLPAARVDANQLELAVLNLVINARDAMPEGGTVTIAAELVERGAVEGAGLPPGEYLRLAVYDTGHGMDAATLRRATEPFFTTKGDGKGTGLGLSMVHGLAAQSGGTMKIDSAPGRGTRVELWLPAADTGVEQEFVEQEEGGPVSEQAGPLVVLVVDDDALVGMGTAAMVEDLGHAPIEAMSGPAALKLLTNRPDIKLVITDQAMPGMTGIELANEIRRLKPGLPIILASGYADLPLGQTTDLPRLAKPFRQEELAEAIALAAGSAGRG